MSTEPNKPHYRRLVEIAAVVIGCATVTGYFIGLSSPATKETTSNAIAPTIRSSASTEHHDFVLPAVDYKNIPQASMSPNDSWKNQLVSLKQPAYDLYGKYEPTQQEKEASLEIRAQSRAYNGAPPTIPHPIDQLSTASCNACHAAGLKSETLRASQTPHPYYSNCTQCHVAQSVGFGSATESETLFRDNSFVGAPAPTGGERAYAKAPPVIPHSTWMRNNCLSCHGRTALPGMETTHPWRTNCVQCHAPSAELNQAPSIDASFRPSFPTTRQSNDAATE